MSIELTPQQKRFCEIFTGLWRTSKAAGTERPWVGRQAAMAAGYGETSWSPVNQRKAADTQYNKLMKKQAVIDYIAELGLVKHGRNWKERADNPVSAETSEEEG